MIVEKDKIRIKLEDLLKSHPDGLTITEIMHKTGLARHTVLARLHALIGEGKVEVRKINMAKLHKWIFGGESSEKEQKDKTEQGERVKLVPISQENLIKMSQKQREEYRDKKAKAKAKAIDMATIRAEIDAELRGRKIKSHEAEIKEQRAPILHIVNNFKQKNGGKVLEHIKTGIPGFDDLLDKGIPKGYSVLVAGGAGSGKTILCLQTLINKAQEGKKCFYMSFEESEERLIEHMEGFGWNPRELIKKGNLKLQRINPFDITRNVDALLAKQKGELLIDIDPIILPREFKPDFVAIDSLTAIASAFTGKEDSYRIYIEQLFRFFENLGSTNFLVTETKQIPEIFSQTGVEEFLADGVIVFYNFKRGDVREKGIEVLKMRGENHQKKIVAVTITDSGITVYPDQEVFSGI